MARVQYLLVLGAACAVSAMHVRSHGRPHVRAHTHTAGNAGYNAVTHVDSPDSSKTRLDFATSLLSSFGWTVSHNALVSLVGWMQAEGSPCAFNPLDTTQPWPGATNCNSVGVKNYPGFEKGVNATRDTLKGSATGYAAIRECLRTGADPSQTGDAIASSAWGTGALAKTCIDEAKNSPSVFQEWGAVNIPG